ncbi:MAG: hypothetical protein KDB53_16190, partial [Planctomycetes bacterium]|nr:hypothetical protein [Planctomycetota bacterium]
MSRDRKKSAKSKAVKETTGLAGHDRTELLELYRVMRTSERLDALALRELVARGRGPGLDAQGLEALAGV